MIVDRDGRRGIERRRAWKSSFTCQWNNDQNSRKDIFEFYTWVYGRLKPADFVTAARFKHIDLRNPMSTTFYSKALWPNEWLCKEITEIKESKGGGFPQEIDNCDLRQGWGLRSAPFECFDFPLLVQRFRSIITLLPAGVSGHIWVESNQCIPTTGKHSVFQTPSTSFMQRNATSNCSTMAIVEVFATTNHRESSQCINQLAKRQTDRYPSETVRSGCWNSFRSKLFLVRW